MEAVTGMPLALVASSWLAMATRAFCLHPLGAHSAWHGADPMPRIVERVVSHFMRCLSSGYPATDGMPLGIGRWANSKWGYAVKDGLFSFVVTACALDSAGKALSYHADLMGHLRTIVSDLSSTYPVLLVDA